METFTTAFTATFQSLYSSILSVLNPIALVCIGICGIMLVFSSDAQSARSVKSWLIRIAVGFIVANAAQLIVNTLQALASSAH